MPKIIPSGAKVQMFDLLWIKTICARFSRKHCWILKGLTQIIACSFLFSITQGIDIWIWILRILVDLQNLPYLQHGFVYVIYTEKNPTFALGSFSVAQWPEQCTGNAQDVSSISAAEGRWLLNLY